MSDIPRVAREPDAEELHKEQRARVWKGIAQAALAAAVVLVLGFQAWNSFLIRDAQAGSRETLQQVLDCTTPRGECFIRGQQQTSGAVAGINTITVRAAACMTAILKQYPDGQQVNVDAVANQIQQCIRTTTMTIKPERVVPAPPAATQGTTPTVTPPAPPVTKPKPRPVSHPKVQGGPVMPTPTGTPTAGLVASLCELLPLRPVCP